MCCTPKIRGHHNLAEAPNSTVQTDNNPSSTVVLKRKSKNCCKCCMCEENTKELTDEQCDELAALQAIYADSFQILPPATTGSPASSLTENNFSFKIKFDTEAGEMGMRVSWPPTYPHTLPTVALEATNYVINKLNSSLQTLQAATMAEAERNIGTVMVFTLVTFVQGWVEENMTDKKPVVPVIQMKKQEVVEEKGTPVTKEAFSAWYTKFMTEREQARSAELRKREQNGVLTGIYYSHHLILRSSIVRAE